MRQREQQVMFSFGENWKSFLTSLDSQAVERATLDIDDWLGVDGVRGRSVVDVGSGSVFTHWRFA
jgi:hypothetical protein